MLRRASPYISGALFCLTIGPALVGFTASMTQGWMGGFLLPQFVAIAFVVGLPVFGLPIILSALAMVRFLLGAATRGISIGRLRAWSALIGLFVSAAMPVTVFGIWHAIAPTSAAVAHGADWFRTAVMYAALIAPAGFVTGFFLPAVLGRRLRDLHATAARAFLSDATARRGNDSVQH